jgi:hypothetical protein
MAKAPATKATPEPISHDEPVLTPEIREAVRQVLRQHYTEAALYEEVILLDAATRKRLAEIPISEPHRILEVLRQRFEHITGADTPASHPDPRGFYGGEEAPPVAHDPAEAPAHRTFSAELQRLLAILTEEQIWAAISHVATHGPDETFIRPPLPAAIDQALVARARELLAERALLPDREYEQWDPAASDADVVNEALRALISQESQVQLAALGGTMPDLEPMVRRGGRRRPR